MPMHAAEEDQDQLEVDRPLGQLARYEPDGHQQIGTHAGGEELERLLDPEMHHPPAPEIGDREGLLDPGERDHAEHVEDGDVDRGGPDQVFQPDAPRPELPRRLPQHRPVGHSARNISPLQTSRPRKKPICQNRPSWI